MNRSLSATLEGANITLGAGPVPALSGVATFSLGN